MRHCYIAIFVAFFTVSPSSGQTVTVDMTTERQTIVANGINFEGFHRTGGSELLKSDHRRMLEELPSDLVRVGTPLKEFERVNDNDDSDDINWSGFNLGGSVETSFRRLEYLENQGLQTWLAIWDVGDWLVENPAAGHARRIRDMDEFVEAISAYLLRAREEYGVEPVYVSVNEPTIAAENGWGGYDLALSAEEQIELIEKGGSRFEELELSTKWLIALHKVYPSEIAQAKEIYADPDIRPYVAGFDFHGYWFQSGRDRELEMWGNWVATTGLPAFCGECDYDNQFWKRNDRGEWSHAVESGKLFHKMYGLARASGSQVWYGDEPSSNRPYRYAAKHFYEALQPGAVIVEVTSNDPNVLALGAKNPDTGTFSLQLQNTSSSPVSLTVEGLPDASLAWVRSIPTRYYGQQPRQHPEGGTLQITLEPFSLNTLIAADVNLGTGDSRGVGVHPPFPNPASDLMTFVLENDSLGSVELTIYDLLGRVVKRASAPPGADTHVLEVNVGGLSAGTYLYLAEGSGSSRRGSLVVVR